MALQGKRENGAPRYRRQSEKVVAAAADERSDDEASLRSDDIQRHEQPKRKRSRVMGVSRRTLLKSGVAAAVCAPALIRQATASDPIVIASMYDLSGGLEAAGKPMYDVLNFAVDEMNASGGLLGREIKVVSFDTQTNMQLYAQYAQEAALKNKVAVVHGGITSASREVIRPVLDKYKTLYFYDMPYEGGVCSRRRTIPRFWSAMD
jgi:ABC-type branched-subunit amino acid transport system substrate-binding protein